MKYRLNPLFVGLFFCFWSLGAAESQAQVLEWDNGARIERRADEWVFYAPVVGTPTHFQSFVQEGKMLWIRNAEGKYGLLSCGGALLQSCEYDAYVPFGDGLAWLLKAEGGDSLWVCVDSAGNRRFEFGTFSEVQPFDFQSAWVYVRGKPNRDDRRWGLMGTDGYEKIAPLYPALGECRGSVCIVAQKIMDHPQTGQPVLRWGCIDRRTYQPLLRCQYEALQFADEQRIITYNNGKAALTTPQGKTLCMPLYEELTPLDSNTLGVRMGKLWGLMDRDGNVVAELRYQALRPAGGGFYAARIDGLWGLIDRTGRARLAFVHEHLGKFDTESGRIWAQKNKRLLLLDTMGTAIASFPDKMRCTDFAQGRAWLLDQWGARLIDARGKTLSKLRRCTYASGFVEGCSLVHLQGRMGLVDTEGRWLLPAVYDAVPDEAFKGFPLRAALHESRFWLNREGKVCSQCP